MDFFRTNATLLLIALFAIALVQFVILLSLSSRLSRTHKLVRSLLTGPNGEDLEAMLATCREESRQALERGDELENRIVALATEMRGCVQHIGLVRYDAYDDVSGEQSFSAALLDGHHNGAIITGLFGRQDSRCYGKAIFSGQTSQQLSDEESAALQMALEGGIISQAPDAAPRKRLGRQKRAALERETE